MRGLASRVVRRRGAFVKGIFEPYFWTDLDPLGDILDLLWAHLGLTEPTWGPLGPKLGPVVTHLGDSLGLSGALWDSLGLALVFSGRFLSWLPT